MRYCLAALLVLLPGVTLASRSPLMPDDFAFGYNVVLEDSAAIYRLPLPPDVYRRVTQRALSDLRVFNGAGEPVPHTLRRPDPGDPADETTAELPFFPLPAATDDPNRTLAVQVTRDARGAVVRVEEGAAVSPDGRPGAYLIDTSQLERPPDAIELEWTDVQESFVAKVDIAGSDDLASWHTMVKTASVAQLNFEGRRLERRRIAIPRKPSSYLRLDWLSEVRATMLTRVTAYFKEPLPPVRRGWVELEGVPVESDRPAFEYELPGHPPIDRVGLSLPPGNALVSVAVSSRKADETWRERYRGTFYRLTLDGAELVSEDAAIATVQAPHWRVEPQDDPGITGAPRLRLGWVLDDLYFLASGNGPYMLAYGAAGATRGPTAVDELISRLDEKDAETFIGTARAGESLALGGEARLIPPPAPLPWQQILLWSVLVSGAGGLGIVAWRLWRQVRDTDRT